MLVTLPVSAVTMSAAVLARFLRARTPTAGTVPTLDRSVTAPPKPSPCFDAREVAP